MSEANVEVVRRLPWGADLAVVLNDPELLEATRSGLEPALDPDVEMVADPTGATMGGFGGVTVGVDGFIRFGVSG